MPLCVHVSNGIGGSEPSSRFSKAQLGRNRCSKDRGVRTPFSVGLFEGEEKVSQFRDGFLLLYGETVGVEQRIRSHVSGRRPVKKVTLSAVRLRFPASIEPMKARATIRASWAGVTNQSTHRFAFQFLPIWPRRSSPRPSCPPGRPRPAPFRSVVPRLSRPSACALAVGSTHCSQRGACVFYTTQ